MRMHTSQNIDTEGGLYTRKSATDINMVVTIFVVELFVKSTESGPGVIDTALRGRMDSIERQVQKVGKYIVSDYEGAEAD